MRKKEMLKSILLKQERLKTQLMDIDGMIKSLNRTKEVDTLELNKELEVGKWYKGNYYDTKYLVFPTELHNTTVIRGYGFDDDGSWCVFNNDAEIGKNTRLAFSNEVESALIEEAIKCGHKYEKFEYNHEENALYGYNGRLEEVFVNGKWKWFEIENPYCEYRIKPEEKPKVVWKESLIRESHIYEIATNSLVKLCHGLAKDAGWHDKSREVGTMLALIHSEVSEAMEGFRKDLNDDHLTKRKMAEVELADAVIRIFDLAGAQGFDLGGALVEKLVYNTQRADHKVENRDKENGKKF